MPEETASGWGRNNGSNAARGTSQLGQLSFNWLQDTQTPPAAAPSPATEASVTAPIQQTAQPPSPGPAKLRRSLQDIVERYLRGRGVPYIAVDEAKKALFAGAKLKSFHFVVYQQAGPNWLVWVGQMRKNDREDLVEWEKIFGDGFKAVIVNVLEDQKLRFKTLAGEDAELK